MRKITCLAVFISGLLLVPPQFAAESKQAKSEKKQAGKCKKIDFSAIKSPVVLKGNFTTAYRDPTAIYHDGVFRLYFTYVRHHKDGNRFHYLGMSKSTDLVNWTKPKALTPGDEKLNYSSPGNIIRYKDQWIICLQTYPTPKKQRYGDGTARPWIMRSADLETWSEPELLRVKGPDVPREKMGRLIDPYLIQDKDTPGKWWCLFDDNALNMSYSHDLKTWTYVGRVPAGENPCVIMDRGEYLVFHSPKNGIGMKRSTDMKNWRDTGELITLGQQGWPWSNRRLTAGFVLDLRKEPAVGKYLMFFHGAGPKGSPGGVFHRHCQIGLAWSDDLKTWSWPGKEKKGS